MIKAVLFDFSETLGYKKNPVDTAGISKILRKGGHEIYVQEWDTARHFVTIIDYPKGKIKSLENYIKQTCLRLDLRISKKTFEKIVKIYKNAREYVLYDDFKYVKQLKIKKAIVTTIPHFRFDYLDVKDFYIVDGKEAKHAKGHPACFEKPMKKWKLKPKEVLVIRNDPYLDMFPASQSGMNVILIDRANSYKKAKYKKINSLKQLKDVISWIK